MPAHVSLLGAQTENGMWGGPEAQVSLTLQMKVQLLSYSYPLPFWSKSETTFHFLQTL